MQLLEYLAILRRRWVYVALGLLVGLVAGYLTAPGGSGKAGEYEATHYLLVNPSSVAGQSINLEQSVLLVTNGNVPERVQKALEEEGLPEFNDVDAVASPALRSLDITATSSTREGAEKAANMLAVQVNLELAGADFAAREAQIEAAQATVDAEQARVTELEGQLAALPEGDPGRVEASQQLQAAAVALTNAQTALAQLEITADSPPPLRTLESADADPVKTVGWQIPSSKPARAVLLGVFGLLLGALGALAADRLDTRVRGKDDAERVFGLPVVAEIPPLSGKSRELLVATRPASPFVEAYRALRTVVLFATAEAEAAAPPTNGSGPPATVILITSPSAGEGKTTTAAHLAAVLAEGEKRVLVISADFRRPRIHEYFGVAREPGLSDVLEPGTGRVRLADLNMATSFAGVHLIPSGGPVDNPAQLLNESSHLIAAARKLFDYIVIDTPPLLVANDATELAAEADMVILVAKADRTTREGAARATEILRRVDAPLLGVCVSAAHDIPTAYGYYKYRYYSESDQGKRRSRRKRDREAPSTNGVDAASSERVGELHRT